MKNREQIIKAYIEAYNKFDIGQMISNLDQNIVFENIQDGKVTLSISGIENFEKQAQEATNYFSARKQTITSFHHEDHKSEIEIDYAATLAIDLPNGLKKGDELKLKGKSLFEFSNNNKIQRLTDIS